jgi:hypothetical protein
MLLLLLLLFLPCIQDSCAEAALTGSRSGDSERQGMFSLSSHPRASLGYSWQLHDARLLLLFLNQR